MMSKFYRTFIGVMNFDSIVIEKIMTFGIHQSRFNIRGFNIHGSHAKVCGLFLFIKNL